MAEKTVGREKLMKKLKAEQKKNADVRARKNAKPGSGTITEKVRKAAKKAPEKRGLPARVEQSRGNVNKANPPKEIRLKGEGGTGRSLKGTRFKPIPLGERPKALPAPAKANVKTFNPGAAAGRLLGPAGFLFGMTTPAGEGSDKPRGPLMRGGKQPGYKYRDEGQTVSGIKGDLERGTPKPAVVTREMKVDKASPAPKPKPRPAGGMTETKRRAAMDFRKKAQGQRKEAPKAERPKFRGNWAGAAPTGMQARAGQKIKRKSFADLFRNK
jgi:hypothetical protein